MSSYTTGAQDHCRWRSLAFLKNQLIKTIPLKIKNKYSKNKFYSFPVVMSSKAAQLNAPNIKTKPKISNFFILKL